MEKARAPSGAKRQDRRMLAFVIVVLALAILSQLFAWWFDRIQSRNQFPVAGSEARQWLPKESVEDLLRLPVPVAGPMARPTEDPRGHQRQATRLEIDERFRQGAAMLHAGRHEEAVAALHRLLQLAPTMPEAHSNMGYALLGLGRHRDALDFFHGAADLEPMLTNAYFGMALAHEGLGDLRQAVETMETYLHLEREDARYQRKAAAAVWEWRWRLENGTDAIPPGAATVQPSQGGDAHATSGSVAPDPAR